jgi:hypothetical protein
MLAGFLYGWCESVDFRTISQKGIAHVLTFQRHEKALIRDANQGLLPLSEALLRVINGVRQEI